MPRKKEKFRPLVSLNLNQAEFDEFREMLSAYSTLTGRRLSMSEFLGALARQSVIYTNLAGLPSLMNVRMMVMNLVVGGGHPPVIPEEGWEWDAVFRLLYSLRSKSTRRGRP